MPNYNGVWSLTTQLQYAADLRTNNGWCVWICVVDGGGWASVDVIILL